jgi:hypothetical protein
VLSDWAGSGSWCARWVGELVLLGVTSAAGWFWWPSEVGAGDEPVDG